MFLIMFMSFFASAGEFLSRELRIPSHPSVVVGPCNLGATLLLPRNEKPRGLVVLVHGSGTHDRNETIGAHTPFRDISEHLSRQGFATLRFDKRGIQPECQPALIDNPELSPWHFVDDVRNVIRYTQQQKDLRHVPLYLLGHSEGVNFVTEIAASREFKVEGLILLAGLSKFPIDVTLLRQLRNGLTTNPDSETRIKLSKLIDDGEAFFKRLRAGEMPAETYANVRAIYWKDWITITEQGAQSALQARVPTLLLQGTLDANVTEEDYEALRQATANTPGSRAALIEGANHLFATSTSTQFNTDALHHIADWLKDRTNTCADALSMD